LNATGNALPWVVFLLVLSGIVWGVRRALRRRGGAKAGPAAAATGTGEATAVESAATGEGTAEPETNGEEAAAEANSSAE
jgi:hypothetical protein